MLRLKIKKRIIKLANKNKIFIWLKFYVYGPFEKNSLISYLIKTLEITKKQFLENQIILMILYILMMYSTQLKTH